MIAGNGSYQVLIIAYGNPLRSDDGIAWQAAEQLRHMLQGPAEIFCVRQLTPELAEDLSRAQLVIFLDACCSGSKGRVACERITAAPAQPQFSHHLTPAHLLGLCDWLYGIGPQAFLVTIPGGNFDYGEQPSRMVSEALPRVVEQVVELVRSQLDRGVPAS